MFRGKRKRLTPIYEPEQRPIKERERVRRLSQGPRLRPRSRKYEEREEGKGSKVEG